MDSPVLEYLNTNLFPSDHDIPAVRKVIGEHTTAAEAIDADILSLSQTLSTLIERRDAHIAFARQHSALLGPIRSIPNEILSGIFLACVTARSADNKPFPLCRSHPAVVLSHVCQRWRRLSISTTTLWTTIYLPLPVSPYHRAGLESMEAITDIYLEAVSRWETWMDQLFEASKVWLHRSEEAPLSVSMRATTGAARPCGISSRVAAFLTLLCEAAHRWRRAEFTFALSERGETRFIPTPAATEPLANLLPEDVPLLEYLQLNIRQGSVPYGNSMVDPKMPLLRAPALRSLRLEAIGCKWNATAVDWSSLTHLRFGGYTPLTSAYNGVSLPHAFGMADAFLLLDPCKRLQVCDLSLSSDCWYGPQPSLSSLSTESVRIPTLESLTIRGTLPDETFIDRVEFPSLRNLLFADISSHQGSRRGVEETKCLKWLQRFGQQLSAVSFQFYRLSQDTFSSFLENMRRVETLDITSTYMHITTREDDRVGDLTCPLTPSMDSDKKAIMCPKLRKLRLNVARDGSVLNEAGVLELIAGRRRLKEEGGVSMIEDIEVAFGVVRTMDILAELKTKGVDTVNLRFKASYPSQFRISLFDPDTDY